ncbi:hypothetical protein MNBD_GAMMA05-222 [hydrothermal vent metagenome]|uniref:Uncharacterized protein n=1 Tax=hydrothermal vent metagenome TaxID=652676 RepID=A0A3B0WWG6_9ZZZZ
MKRILISIFLIVNSFSVYGATLSVSTSPGLVSHSVSLNPPINVFWNVGASGNPGVHTSTVGTFRALPGNTGASIGSTINTIITFNIPSSNCTEIADTIFDCISPPEIIRIPADVLAFAGANRLTTIYYNRTFTDGVSATGSVQINLNFTVVNPEKILSITRETLRFNDNSTVKFIKPNTPLTAVAELKFTGTGLLDAFWEYATPSSTTGRAIFIRMNSIRRYLGAGGRVILQSPPLPTDITGQYLVRLQILKTLSNPNGVEFTNDLPDGLPVLRYTIGRKSSGGETFILPLIKTQFPLNNAFLKVDTRFNWQSVKNAKAYQLELYLPDTHDRPTINPSTNVGDKPIDDSVINNKRPSTGLLIPATETSLALSTLSREALKRGKTYYWRIIAIGADGHVLTTSALKKIRTP